MKWQSFRFIELRAADKQVVTRHRYGTIKAGGSPIKENTLADEAESNPLNVHNHTIYRSIMGSLVYIATQIRSDLLEVTCMLTSYLHEPIAFHMVAAKRAL